MTSCQLNGLKSLDLTADVGNFRHIFFAIFKPLTGNRTSPNYFFLVEEVLSFNLVGHM